MTICHVNLSRYYNAPEKQMEILIRKLSEENIQQKLFYRNKKKNRFKNNPKVSPEMIMMFQMNMNLYDNVEHVIKEGKLEVIEFAKIVPYSLLQKECLEKFKSCDILHAHSIKAIFIAYYIKHKFSTPYVITFHKPEPPNTFLYRTFEKFLKRGFEEAEKIITVSDYQHNFMKDWHRKLRDKFVTIHNTPSFYIHEINKGESNFFRNPFNHTVIIGMVGKLLPVKNFELAVDLAYRYVKKNPEIQFVLIGEGPQDAIIQERTRHLFNFKMQEYIMNIEEHIEYFDAFLVTSKKEALGATIVDMLELGKPIIAPNIDGVRELITHGKNGYLFESNNLDDLEKKVDALIGDEVLQERLKRMKLPWLPPVKYGELTDFFKFSRAGKEKAKEFSQDKFKEKHLKIYKTLLKM
jgi:glycosyltransferase involved in cell wall biosynthesis